MSLPGQSEVSGKENIKCPNTGQEKSQRAQSMHAKDKVIGLEVEGNGMAYLAPREDHSLYLHLCMTNVFRFVK